MQKQLNENLKMTRIRLQPAHVYKEVNEPKNSETPEIKGIYIESTPEILAKCKETEMVNSKKLSVIIYSLDDLIQVISEVHQQKGDSLEPFLNLTLQLLEHIQAKKGKINLGFRFETVNHLASDMAILTLDGKEISHKPKKVK